jgi:5-methylcytosine-specific restriction endonuclease McrA
MKQNFVFYKGNWYHRSFFKRRIVCIKKADYTCQHCGKKRGDPCVSKRGRESKVVIQAHHPNNDRLNPKAVLIALCKQCHMKADAFTHGVKGAQTKKRKQRESEISAGQLELPLKFKKERRKPKAKGEH